MGFSLVVSLFALVVAGYLVRDVWRQDSSTAQMQAIADAIREGARAEH
jgi:Na+/H+-translocating membrane pyrophosphatase